MCIYGIIKGNAISSTKENTLKILLDLLHILITDSSAKSFEICKMQLTVTLYVIYNSRTFDLFALKTYD